jgi:phosphoglycolate phosphatase
MTFKFKHVIWDWNGTIVDDSNLCVEIVNEILKNYNLKIVSHDFYLKNFNFPVKNYYKLLGLPVDDFNYKLISEYFIKQYRIRYYNCKLQNGILKILHDFKVRGISQSVLSASNQEDLSNYIDFYNLSEYFSFITGVKDTQANGKQKIAISHFKKINLDRNEVTLIGDTVHDKYVADIVGVSCFLINFGHNSIDSLKICKCSIIESYSELIKFVSS